MGGEEVGTFLREKRSEKNCHISRSHVFPLEITRTSMNYKSRNFTPFVSKTLKKGNKVSEVIDKVPYYFYQSNNRC